MALGLSQDIVESMSGEFSKICSRLLDDGDVNESQMARVFNTDAEHLRNMINGEEPKKAARLLPAAVRLLGQHMH